jgi:hypothetical protein
MNPNADGQPNINLPSPAEVVPAGNLIEEAEPQTPMKTPEFSNTLSQPGLASPPISVNPNPIQPLSIVPDVSQPIPSTNVTSRHTNNPAVAADNDLIEKEWVIKAKQIVEQNREDPYAQTMEINRFKADYLKKRYNKDLKVNEE